MHRCSDIIRLCSGWELYPPPSQSESLRSVLLITLSSYELLGGSCCCSPGIMGDNVIKSKWSLRRGVESVHCHANRCRRRRLVVARLITRPDGRERAGDNALGRRETANACLISFNLVVRIRKWLKRRKPFDVVCRYVCLELNYGRFLRAEARKFASLNRETCLLYLLTAWR
jgi:hypothetical protein